MVQKALSVEGIWDILGSALIEWRDLAVLISNGTAFQVEGTTKAMRIRGKCLGYLRNYKETVWMGQVA